MLKTPCNMMRPVKSRPTLRLKLSTHKKTDFTIDSLVATLERTVIETERRVEQIIARGPTPKHGKNKYQNHVGGSSHRVEEIRKVLRSSKKSLRYLLAKQRGILCGPKTASAGTQTANERPNSTSTQGTQTMEIQSPNVSFAPRTPPTKVKGAGQKKHDWKTKALVKIRRAMYKEMSTSPSLIKKINYDEYEQINQSLKELGIRPKPLPIEITKPYSSKKYADDEKTVLSPSSSSNGHQASAHDHAPASASRYEGKYITEEERFGGAKPIEYMFAKILAGPMSKKGAEGAVVPAEAPFTPPRTPQKSNRRHVKTPPSSSGRKRERSKNINLLSRSPTSAKKKKNGNLFEDFPEKRASSTNEPVVIKTAGGVRGIVFSPERLKEKVHGLIAMRTPPHMHRRTKHGSSKVHNTNTLRRAATRNGKTPQQDFVIKHFGHPVSPIIQRGEDDDEEETSFFLL